MKAKLFVIGLFVMFICASLIYAQGGSDNPETEKSVKIKYYGQAAFGVTTSSGTKIIIDPANFKGYKMPDDITADIITISHEHMDHNIINFDSKNSAIFHGTDEECGKVNVIDTTIADVKFYSVSSFHSPGGHRYNAIFVYEFDGIRLAHLGDIGTTLTDKQIEAIGEIDILMIPVGGYYTIDLAQVDSIVTQLNVKQMVIPMHFKTKEFDGLPNTAEDFLKDKKNVNRLDSNELVVDLSDLGKKLEYVLLKH
ncbi:MAG: MBL fold metallo-hydrolase [candidate division Zixibacteria bacterium]|nr:MBL fold metallo-hydrolase [candidate division Zixibacteria bacterium]